MKILQFGAGRVGEILADLIGEKHNLTVCDILMGEIFENHSWEYIENNNEDFERVIKHTKPSLVISCLPYKYNLTLGTYCIKNKIMYADLGGHEETSSKLRSLATKNKSHVPIATDLGLAPGLANVIACYIVDFSFDRPSYIEIYCGGLPNDRRINELGYQVTFNPEGLLNEYYAGGLSYQTNNIKSFESFHTYGGLGHTFGYSGVDFLYRTLRYPGHRVKFNDLYNEYGHEGMISLLNKRYTYDTYDDHVVMFFKMPSSCFPNDFVYKFDNNNMKVSSLSELTAKGAYWCIEQMLDDIVPKSILYYYDFDCEKIIKSFEQDKCTSVV